MDGLKGLGDLNRRDQLVDQPTTRQMPRPRHVTDSQLLARYVGRTRCWREAALCCHLSVCGSRGVVYAVSFSVRATRGCVTFPGRSWTVWRSWTDRTDDGPDKWDKPDKLDGLKGL